MYRRIEHYNSYFETVNEVFERQPYVKNRGNMVIRV